MPEEDNKTLKNSLGEKSMKAPFIYSDLECTLKKMNTRHNNP